MGADLVPLLLGVAALVAAGSAVAYPQAFPDASKTAHRIVFLAVC
jgi:hypothetical protein